MLQLNSPYPFMQSMFEEAAAMHASAIRLDVAPALVFHDPLQPPDFTGLDEVVALANAYHLRVVADLTTIPWWISACATPRDISQMTLCGTDDLADYRAEITEIVRRADPAIHDWEIWNEPDLGSFFSGTPLQYAWMLRTAHDAIKAVDPQADVLLGGISGLSGENWLTQVFAAAGPDALHAFDIANIHERDRLDLLAGDVAAWRWFFAADGFSGPLWITEHGYPSDPAFQYDPSYAGGSASQAAFLSASIPTLLDAGAAKVFVTERDNLGGQFASEGVLGGNVLDPPPADAQPIEKPAFATVRALADCYSDLGRNCGATTPAATPSSLAIPATRLRAVAVSYVTVSDPGTGPVQLGAVTLAGAAPSPVSVQSDGCSGQILEPDHPCTVALRFAPVAGGAVTNDAAGPLGRRHAQRPRHGGGAVGVESELAPAAASGVQDDRWRRRRGPHPTAGLDPLKPVEHAGSADGCGAVGSECASVRDPAQRLRASPARTRWPVSGVRAVRAQASGGRRRHPDAAR